MSLDKVLSFLPQPSGEDRVRVAREHDGEWWWRWMEKDAAWTIVNTSARPIVAAIGLEMSAFHRPRRMELRLDGRSV